MLLIAIITAGILGVLLASAMTKETDECKKSIQ